MEDEKTTSETQNRTRPDHSQLNAFENFYENFPQSAAEIH